MRAQRTRPLTRAVESLLWRVEALVELRRMVPLPESSDLTARQWSLIQGQLTLAKEQIASRAKQLARTHLAHSGELGRHARLRLDLGDVELELAHAFSLFDTYMDILTQRLSPELGPLLRGCDELARDGLDRDHPGLQVIESPLVYCDRGIGASVVREGVRVPHGPLNPLPLVQIPYARLREKHNLVSVLHEIGHEAVVRAGIREEIAAVLRNAAVRAGGSVALGELFAAWASEIGPDFWAFCSTGVAQALTVRDVLSLPRELVLRGASTDPHPPPYLRVLLAFAWCRHAFGAGAWDEWCDEWRDRYRPGQAPPDARRLLEQGEALLPAVADALFGHRFDALGRRRITELFELDALAPTRLRALDGATVRSPKFAALRPAMQLGILRLARENSAAKDAFFEATMDSWLRGLARRGRARDLPPSAVRKES